MATSETKENICLVCLEAPAVRKVDKCEHSYCENCLSPANFACPQCVTEGGEGQGKDCTVGGGHGSNETEVRDQKTSLTTLVQVNCKLCHFKGETVMAVNQCKDCKSLPLCGDCSKKHQKSKATEKHVVVSLDSVIKKYDVLCDEHGELIQLFCKSCSEVLCHICVSLNHSDHVVDQFNNVVVIEVEKIRTALEHQERRLDMFKSDEDQLRQSKATVQEMEDALIKSIEDHAEKCIEEILKNKEALKKQVKSDFAVGQVLENRLEIMTELEATVSAANRLLNKQAEVHPKYVAKLVGLKEELAKLKEGQPDYEEDKANYQQDFKDLREKAISFYPRTPNCKIGGFKDMYYAGSRCDAGGPCVCQMCERKADKSREGECRERKRCVCGTCGCHFNRVKLYGRGKCAYMSNESCCSSLITLNRAMPYKFP